MVNNLTKTDSRIIKFLYSTLKVRNTYRSSNIAKRINHLFKLRKDKIVKVSLNRPISKNVFSQIFINRHNRFRIGYIKRHPKKVLVGAVIYEDKRMADTPKMFKKTRFLISEDYDKTMVLFKMVDTNLSIIGNKERLLGSIAKRLGSSFVQEHKNLVSTDPHDLIYSLTKINERDSKIWVSRVEYQDIEKGKRLRIKAYADRGTTLDRFVQKNLKNKNSKYELTNIIAISFTDLKEIAILKVSRLNENQYILKWKNNNELTRKISELYKLSDSVDSLVLDKSDDIKLLNDLFRHETVSNYETKRIYNRILKEYGNYIDITNNRVRLNYQNILQRLNQVTHPKNYRLDPTYIEKKYGLYFPLKKAKAPYRSMLRIMYNGKIIQYILLDHERLYELDNEPTIREFFIFSPFIILDFRKAFGKDFDYFIYNDYIVNSGVFLYTLKNRPLKLLNIITNQGKDIIEKFELNDHYKIACELLDKLDTFNLNPQQKGALFEAICFMILSKIFLVRRIGGPSKPDGGFVIDDTDIIYDAKNLSPETKLMRSVTKNKKIKDIDYIRQWNAKNYIYITRNVTPEEFNKVKQQIESAVTGCTVSAINSIALKNLVDLYDARTTPISKIKRKLCSGEFISQISRSDIT